MPIQILVLPIIGSGKTPEDAFRPDFGMAKVGRWGQVSDKWAPKGQMCVWVECDDTALVDLKATAVQDIGEVAKQVDLATQSKGLMTDSRALVATAEIAIVAEVAAAEALIDAPIDVKAKP